MPRDRHSKKEVEEVLQAAEALGWTIIRRKGKGHAWGLLRCPKPSDECRCGQYCQMSINSTPENPGAHAAKLIGKVHGCTNPLKKDDEDGGTV